jgi:hypothetical protein
MVNLYPYIKSRSTMVCDQETNFLTHNVILNSVTGQNEYLQLHYAQKLNTSKFEIST